MILEYTDKVNIIPHDSLWSCIRPLSFIQRFRRIHDRLPEIAAQVFRRP
jgi:hypothetical protein